MLMMQSSLDLLNDRLVEAFDTLKRLPTARALPHLVSWPDVVQETSRVFASHPKKIPPSPAAIDRCEEVFGWLFRINRDARRLLWARAGRIPWRILAHEYGVSHMTLRKRHRESLKELAGTLENMI